MSLAGKSARVCHGPCRDRGGNEPSSMTREGRRPDELRPIELLTDFVEQAHGSVLVSFGRTRVLCTATVVEGVPRWLAGGGRGWITAEYGMLPASTGVRTEREASSGRQKGRTVEMERLGERTIWLDCEVLQADGGTRTAAITGAWVALTRAAARHGLAGPSTVVSAVSVGLVDGVPLLDLDYAEDAGAEVDMNVVMTGDGRLNEVQATAEKTPFSRAGLDALIDLAAAGITRIARLQQEAVAGA